MCDDNNDDDDVAGAAVAEDADGIGTVVGSMDDGTWFTFLLSDTSDGCL